MLIAFVGSLPLPSSPLLCSPPPSHCPPPLLCSPLVWDPQSFSPTIFASLAVRPSVRPKCIHSSSNNCRCHPLTGRTDTRAPHLIPEFRSKGTGANHLAEEERGRCGDRERRGEERRGGEEGDLIKGLLSLSLSLSPLLNSAPSLFPSFRSIFVGGRRFLLLGMNDSGGGERGFERHMSS